MMAKTFARVIGGAAQGINPLVEIEIDMNNFLVTFRRSTTANVSHLGYFMKH